MKRYISLIAVTALLAGFLAGCVTKGQGDQGFDIDLEALARELSPYKMGGEGGEGT